MKPTFRIALIGDYDPAVTAHQAIPRALLLAASDSATEIQADWLHTSTIHNVRGQLFAYDGIWCVPASPYANTAGAISAIQYAREKGVPFLGTCGGFQHAIVEFARNVCGIADADHAETNAAAATCVISPLSCSLVEESEALALAEGSLLQRAYSTREIVEQYHCSYGLNPDFTDILEAAGMRVSARDALGAVRAMELQGHPFFVGTLFQSERRALRGETPPIVRAFVEAVAHLATARNARTGATARA